MRVGRPEFNLTRPGLHLGDPGYVGARPNHWLGQGRGLCRREFVTQSEMRVRGRDAERTRPI